MKPLLIGEQPSKHGDPSRPLEGRIGLRLADYAGITYEEYLERFERMNLLDVRAEYATHGNGHQFDAEMAKIRAEHLIRKRFAPGRAVIVCGKRAAGALGIPSGYFEVHLLNGSTVYVIPHPSGANRWWNDADNQLKMKAFMRELMRIECVQTP